jgi:hypothetical protein
MLDWQKLEIPVNKGIDSTEKLFSLAVSKTGM